MKKNGGVEIYSNETADRLSKDYGIDAADELGKILYELCLHLNKCLLVNVMLKRLIEKY